jgi:hypothetical protein
MKTEDLVDIFSAGRIEIVNNRDTEKLNAIIAALTGTGTIADSLAVLTAHQDTIQFLQRIMAEANLPTSTLFAAILRNLNAATPASDHQDVLL